MIYNVFSTISDYVKYFKNYWFEEEENKFEKPAAYKSIHSSTYK